MEVLTLGTKVYKNCAFNDAADSLRYEFRNDASNSVIILGVHYCDSNLFYNLKKTYDKVIVFNFEQLLGNENRWVYDKNFFKWCKLADELWDYDEQNIEDVLQFIRTDVKLHILKPYKDWNSYQPVKKDIDILFYGSMNEHRRIILDKLKMKYKVVELTNVYGDALDTYILRSKVLLNLHYYTTNLQEQARMIRWIGAPCRIISEKSVKNYLSVEEIDYNEIGDLVI